LFGAGLRLRIPLYDRGWWVPLRLAFLSMTVTVGLIAALAWWLLGLSPGLAILLGAILAPTDPVLAGEVQVRDPWDRDRLRLGLTAEAGLNDGTAFPFVLLGLVVMGLEELGPGGVRWIAGDLVGTTVGGVVIGAFVATAVGSVVLHLRRRYNHGVGLDAFLMLGIVAVAYGGATLVHASGFLASFAAGVFLRRIERRELGDRSVEKELDGVSNEEEAVDENHAPAYLARALLDSNEQAERIAELGLVVVVGAMLANVPFDPAAIWLVPALIVVVRPLAVVAGLIGAGVTTHQRRLIAWFGLRGIGSLYYLAFALEQGVGGADAEILAGLTLSAIAGSVIIHGVSVTPLLRRYPSDPRERGLQPGGEPEPLR
jgi:NhaP-type Na+/H+ or K+/H+ antiporter